MGYVMKAISLWQPWATAVLLKWKTIETRTHARFKSLQGQRIAIHAAKKVDKDVTDLFYDNLPRMTALEIENLFRFVEICRGKIMCTAHVITARWAPNVDFDVREKWNRQALCEVGGKYLLFLDEIEPLRNIIPFRGRQGIFNVPDEVIEAARRE